MKIFNFEKFIRSNNDTQGYSAIIPKGEKERFLSYASQYAYKGFMDGKPEYADELQKVFLFDDAQHLQRQVAQAFLEKLRTSNIKQLIRLSEESRKSICVYGEEAYYCCCWENWKNAMMQAHHYREKFSYLTDDQYVSVLCMGTFNSNGYYRQMCLKELKNCGLKLHSEVYGMEISPLSFYLLRVNDWVSEIRNLAKALTIEEILHCDVGNLLLMMPSLEKIRNSHRRESICFYSRIRYWIREGWSGFCSARRLVMARGFCLRGSYNFIFPTSSMLKNFSAINVQI